jgi:two-component system, OmpR family, response regulator
LHDDIYDRSIDVQILRLRRKIEPDPNEPKLIRTERGAGYFFDTDVTS